MFHYQNVEEVLCWEEDIGSQKNNIRNALKGSSLLSALFFFGCFVGLLLGMCESVRTRNTLYEVGAAKSKIWHNAVERRKKKKEKKDKMINI